MFGDRTSKISLNILKYENIKDTTRNMKRYKWLLQRDAEGFFVAEICDSAQSSASSASAIGFIACELVQFF